MRYELISDIAKEKSQWFLTAICMRLGTYGFSRSLIIIVISEFLIRKLSFQYGGPNLKYQRFGGSLVHRGFTRSQISASSQLCNSQKFYYLSQICIFTKNVGNCNLNLHVRIRKSGDPAKRQ